MTLSSVHWLRPRHWGVWHAWEHGSTMSFCAKVTAEHLKAPLSNRPAREGNKDHALGLDRDAMELHVGPLLPDMRLCVECRRRAMVAHRPQDDPLVSQWAGVVRRTVTMSTRKGIRTKRGISERYVVQLASLLSTYGTPSNGGQEVWRVIPALLLLPWERRMLDLGKALEILERQPESLASITSAVTAWRRVSNTNDFGLYKAPTVCETMLQIPEPEPYVRRCVQRGLTAFAQVFHPNTLARAYRDGMLQGAMTKGHAEYVDKIRGQLTIIEE